MLIARAFLVYLLNRVCRAQIIRHLTPVAAWMKESKISLINLREQGKSMSNYTRMFRGKMRMSTCRIILITSLAWLLIDVIIIMKYTDGLGGGIFKKSQSEVGELEITIKVRAAKVKAHKWFGRKKKSACVARASSVELIAPPKPFLWVMKCVHVLFHAAKKKRNRWVRFTVVLGLVASNLPATALLIY